MSSHIRKEFRKHSESKRGRTEDKNDSRRVELGKQQRGRSNIEHRNLELKTKSGTSHLGGIFLSNLKNRKRDIGKGKYKSMGFRYLFNSNLN